MVLKMTAADAVLVGVEYWEGIPPGYNKDALFSLAKLL